MTAEKRFGIGFMGEVHQPLDALRLGVEAESAGFHSCWILEHPAYMEAFSTLGAIACRTSSIMLGTAVVSVLTRHPVITAMAAATLQALSGGRAILGIGTGSKLWMESSYGLSMDKPLRIIKEAVEIITTLYKDGAAEFEGQRFTARRLFFDVKMPSPPPIYIGAVGQAMQRTAAKIADGVVFSACSSPSYVSKSISLIKQELDADRKARKFEYVCLLFVSLDRDEERAADALRPFVATYLSIPRRAETMLSEDTLRRTRIDDIRRAVASGRIDEACRLLSVEAISEVALYGGENRIVDGIDRYLSAGVSLPVLIPIRGAEQVLRLVGALGSSF